MPRRQELVEPSMDICRPLDQTKTNFLRCRLIRHILSEQFLEWPNESDNELGRFKPGNHSLRDPQGLYSSVITDDIDFLKSIPGFARLEVKTVTGTTTKASDKERQKIVCVEASALDTWGRASSLPPEEGYKDEVLSVKIEVCWLASNVASMKRAMPLPLGQIQDLVKKATKAYFEGWGERRATCREIDDAVVGFAKVL